MNIKRSKGEIAFGIANAIVMAIMIILCVYPLLYVLFASLSDPHRLVQHRGLLTSSLGFTLKGYELVLKNPSIATGYANTLFYVIFGTAVNLFMTALGAYVLSRRRAYWVNKLMFAIVFTMYFSGGLIPNYLLVRNLGLMNNPLAIILPGAISTWNLIIMRTAFLAIPVSLEESARIDGAKDLTILFKIILPLSLPVVAVMALFYGVHHWNAWFNAMMYFRKRELYPLQLILREILIQNQANSVIQSDISQMDLDIYRTLVQYCTIIVATGPILFVYPFLQKYFVKGVMVGAIKG